MGLDQGSLGDYIEEWQILGEHQGQGLQREE